MAVDIHLKIETIPGQSEVKGFENQIQVDSFSWNMEQTTSFSQSSGGGAGKVNMGDFSFTHVIDKSTPKLMIACCTGQHIPEAVLTCRKVGGSEGVDYLKITLKDVLVSAVAPSGVGAHIQQPHDHATGQATGHRQHATGDNPHETVSLAFAEYKIEYQEQDNKGGKKGGPVIAGFSVQKNAKTA